MNKIIVPPIKSQGIKTKLVPWIKAIIPQNDGKWIEPFMGTGVVAFNVGFKETLLNDINPHLIKFYNSIKDRTINPRNAREYLEYEGSILQSAEDNGYHHYKFIRDRFNNSFNSLDFLFLSRAGFNGMIRFNKNGKWNIPFCKKPDRFAKSYVTKIVNQIANVACQITPAWSFECRDFREIIESASSNDIIYCDPPYHGRYVDYYNGWSDRDEKDLYTLLKNTKAKFILSTWHHNDYRNNLMIDKYWNEFNIVTRDHFYHSGGKIENRNSIVEALVYNFESSIKKHNYELIPTEEQLTLFEKREAYLAEKLKDCVNS
ncbi:MAG TPA: Dam family site-specific DNA-(adenine-N6)-methyltransferase [Spirochaetota bacterium]|nr:Dam family site-specific DNA-(adenine-N6)-methyltransferase [Spirochaetota bacterium]